MWGVTLKGDTGDASPVVSTPTPHVGRDRFAAAPLSFAIVSTPTPHVGRDQPRRRLLRRFRVSTPTPHVGRDCRW